MLLKGKTFINALLDKLKDKDRSLRSFYYKLTLNNSIKIDRITEDIAAAACQCQLSTLLFIDIISLYFEVIFNHCKQHRPF